MTDYATHYIKPNDRLTSFERLEIYNRQYWFRVLGSMAEDFPGLRAILGQWRFDDMCRAYLAERPSRSFTAEESGGKARNVVAAESQVDTRQAGSRAGHGPPGMGRTSRHSMAKPNPLFN